MKQKLTHRRNIIELLKEEGEEREAYALAYVYMFIADIADDYIFDGRESLKKLKPHLYKHSLKKRINNAYNACHELLSMIKPYTEEDWDCVLDNLDEYKDRFHKNVFILYNTMLRQTKTKWFEDYDLAKICTQLEVGEILLEYMRRSNDSILENAHSVVRKMASSNDYDIHLNNTLFNLHHFFGELLNWRELEDLGEDHHIEFRNAFNQFLTGSNAVYTENLNKVRSK